MKFIFSTILTKHHLRFSLLIFAFAFSSATASNISAQETNEQPDFVKLFNQGQDAHEKGDFQTAIKFYDEALKANPEFPEGEYQKASALVSLGKTVEAEKSFRRAIELRENWALPMTDLARLLIRKNNLAEAEKLLAKVLEADEKNTEANVALAEIYLRTKPAPDVLKNLLTKLQNLTAQSSSTASLWAARGAIERRLQNNQAAHASLKKALEINPKDELALSESIEIFLDNQDAAGAIKTAETLVQMSPNSTNAKIVLARTYARTSRAADALKILNTLDDSNAEATTLRNSLVANSSNDMAMLEKQLAKEPKNADVLARLCVISRLPAPQKALDYCRQAAELEPNNLNHIIAYGAALVQAKQLDNAVSLFRKVLQIAPDNYTAHANLATAFFETKRYQEAKTEYEWLAKAKPDLAITYYLLGISHDQLQEYAEAKEAYQKFLSLADNKQNVLEIEKVNLRLPSLEKLIKQKGKR